MRQIERAASEHLNETVKDKLQRYHLVMTMAKYFEQMVEHLTDLEKDENNYPPNFKNEMSMYYQISVN